MTTPFSPSGPTRLLRFFGSGRARGLPSLVLSGFLALGAAACGSAGPAPFDAPPEPPEETRIEPPDSQPPAAPEPVLPDSADGLTWAERTLRSLTLREKVGQMMMPWVLGDFAPEGSSSHDRMLGYIEEQEIGGVIMSVGSPTDVAVKLNDLQEHSRLPLLVAADLETGAGFRMNGAVHLPGVIALGGATEFPPLMAVGATGAPGYAYEMGRITAIEARAVGIHVPFAPVLDVNNNPENPIINVRSFGEEPAQVARMGAAFVRGVQEYGAVATGKHFPGHGDTGTDSHLDLPLIAVDRARLDSVELVPFRAAIDGGMGAVMTAHVSMPSITGDDGVPATLSEGALTGLLRRDLDFGGLIFTDAMDMYAIDRRFSREEAAVRAVEAGADVILMPPDVEAAVQGIVDAVCSGRLSEARIDDSVGRLLRAKEELGLSRDPTVPLSGVPRKVGIPEHQELAQEIADRSITLLRNGKNLLPLLGTRSARVLSVTYRRQTDLLAGRWFNGHLRRTYPRLLTAEVHRDTEAGVYNNLLDRARRSQLVVVSTYVTAVSYRGDLAISDDLADFVQELTRIGVPHIVVAFGNPYLIKEFPDIQAYMLAWGGAEVSQRAAARALFGEIRIQGRSPIRIPPFFEIGGGIEMPPKEVGGGP